MWFSTGGPSTVPGFPLIGVNEAVLGNQVQLTNYPVVIWAVGEESTVDETFSVAEQIRVSSYLNAGGRLMVSGSEIAWDLDRAAGPVSADRGFLQNYLHATLAGDVNDDSSTPLVVSLAGGIFSGAGMGRFDDGTGGIYNVRFPDVLTPVGSGARAALSYSGGLGGAAAIQNHDETSGSRLVYFGFPFETLTSAAVRESYMFDVLAFFGVIPAPRISVASVARPIVTRDAPMVCDSGTPLPSCSSRRVWRTEAEPRSANPSWRPQTWRLRPTLTEPALLSSRDGRLSAAWHLRNQSCAIELSDGVARDRLGEDERPSCWSAGRVVSSW